MTRSFEMKLLLLFFLVYSGCAENEIITTVNIGIYLAKVNSETNSQAFLPLKYAQQNNPGGSNIYFNFTITTFEEDDSFKTNKLFCNMLDNRPNFVAVLASESASATPMIASISNSLQIPYIQTSWRQSSSYLKSETALNFYPDFDLYSLGIAKLVKSLQWHSFVILYENFDGLLRLEETLKLQMFEQRNRNKIVIRKLNFNEDIRSTLKQIKQSGEKQIILDCELNHIIEVLRQAKAVGIMTFAHSYFLSSLDAHTLDLKDFDTDANITTVRMMNLEDKQFNKFVKEWEYLQLVDPYKVKTETMLIHESIQLLMAAVIDIHNKNDFTFNSSCKSSEKFKYGFDIISYMKLNYANLPFDVNDGRRTDFTLYLIEGNRQKVIATWNSVNPEIVHFQRTAEESYQKRVETLQTKIQNISARIQPPYLMLKKDYLNRVGNDRYEGYVLDLMNKIAEKLNFKFEIKLVEDGANGVYDEITQSWNGIIGEILNEKAQFGIGDLTITPTRERVIDFSMPFMRLGIGILLQKPESTRSMFAFLKPFSPEVWMYTVTLYLTTSIVLYFVARMAPGDWENPHPCNLDPDELENLWTINNCMWLTMGSVMNQGSDILPKGISSRLVTSMWWFFALIMTNSYTASLAAFLTTEVAVIDDLEDLAKQNRIKYGSLLGGSTQEFFRLSNYSTYRRMYANMVLNLPSVFAKTTVEGVQRVKNTPDGSYAFLMESTTIDYLVERNCDLTTVDKWFNNREYGIAMPLDCPYRTAINDAILGLQETGQLNDLKNKWWLELYRGPVCATPTVGMELRLENVGGIFIVLGVGVAIAFLLGIAEFLWTARQISIEKHITYWQAFKLELSFAFKIWISRKRVKEQIDIKHFTKSSNERSLQLDNEHSEERQMG